MGKFIDSEKKVVTVDVDVKVSKDADSESLTWTLDYSHCDMDDLLERASRTDVITLQARYRAKPFDQSEFDVASDLPGRATSAPKDPKATILQAAKRLSAEELEAILRELKGDSEEE